MTYCVAVVLDSGLVLASDSRSNAGVDHVVRVRKMNVYERPGDRVIVTLCSGNLAVTQAVTDLLDRWAKQSPPRSSLWNVASMHDAAAVVGEALRHVRYKEGPYAQGTIDSSANFIVGGQIAGEAPTLFLIYAEGNYVEASAETPHVMIGENKFGKAIIERVIRPGTSLVNAGKCVLVSFDYTMRSNLSVGLPIDLLMYRRDSLKVERYQRIEEDDSYFSMIQRQWGERLSRLIDEWPDPEWDQVSPQIPARSAPGPSQ